MALPNKAAFAFTFSIKFFDDISVSGSLEFGSKNGVVAELRYGTMKYHCFYGMLFLLAFILGALGIYFGMKAPLFHKLTKSKLK